jgi:hypothetical protein
MKVIFVLFVKKNFINGEIFFSEASILFTSFDNSNIRVSSFNICKNCVKTPEEAEKKVIPLLKILYGEIIKITRIMINEPYKDILFTY